MLRSELRAAGAEQEPPEVRAAVGAEAGGARPRWGTEMPAMTAGGGGGGRGLPASGREAESAQLSPEGSIAYP